MTRYATVRVALLLVAMLLGVPLACGLRIDDQEEGQPPNYGPLYAPPTIVPGGGTCSVDDDCPPGCTCVRGSCSLSSLCEPPSWTCAAGFTCDVDRQTCVTLPAPSSVGQGGGLGGVGGGPSGVGQTAGTGGVPGASGSYNQPGPSVDAGGDEEPASDAGCTSGNDCDDRAPVCLTNDECANGLCVNNRCQSYCADDSACPPGEGCVLGLCRQDAEGFECIVAADCLASDDCVGGNCRRRCLTAEHCADCDDGPVCTVGYCGP
jgi:hypothetical protein